MLILSFQSRKESEYVYLQRRGTIPLIQVNFIFKAQIHRFVSEDFTKEKKCSVEYTNEQLKILCSCVEMRSSKPIFYTLM